MAVEIDISNVPIERRDDPRFLELREQLQAALNDRKWRAAFCIHEAGHKIYLSRLGITEFHFIGPHIVYDEERNDFDGYPAAVKAEPVPLSAEGFDVGSWLLQLAQGKAAGGVFSRRLTEAPDHGDAEDREEFTRGCDLIRQKLPDHPIDEEAIWKQAQESITKALRSPAFRHECWEEARAIEKKLFGSGM